MVRSVSEVGTVKCEKNYELCEGCGQKIHDRYLMRVGDSSWHEQCLACGMCGVPLNNSCYVRNGKLYCKLDYDRYIIFRAFIFPFVYDDGVFMAGKCLARCVCRNAEHDHRGNSIFLLSI